MNVFFIGDIRTWRLIIISHHFECQNEVKNEEKTLKLSPVFVHSGRFQLTSTHFTSVFILRCLVSIHRWMIFFSVFSLQLCCGLLQKSKMKMTKNLVWIQLQLLAYADEWSVRLMQFRTTANQCRYFSAAQHRVLSRCIASWQRNVVVSLHDICTSFAATIIVHLVVLFCCHCRDFTMRTVFLLARKMHLHFAIKFIFISLGEMISFRRIVTMIIFSLIWCWCAFATRMHNF